MGYQEEEEADWSAGESHADILAGSVVMVVTAVAVLVFTAAELSQTGSHISYLRSDHN